MLMIKAVTPIYDTGTPIFFNLDSIFFTILVHHEIIKDSKG